MLTSIMSIMAAPDSSMPAAAASVSGSDPAEKPAVQVEGQWRGRVDRELGR